MTDTEIKIYTASAPTNGLHTIHGLQASEHDVFTSNFLSLKSRGGSRDIVSVCKITEDGDIVLPASLPSDIRGRALSDAKMLVRKEATLMRLQAKLAARKK